METKCRLNNDTSLEENREIVGILKVCQIFLSNLYSENDHGSIKDLAFLNRE